MEFDLFEMLRELFQSLHGSILLGLTVFLYIVIQILRGKVSVGGVQLRIPWLTNKFNTLSKEIKTYLLLSLFGIIGIITTIASVDKLTVWILLDGLICGIITGATTIGVRNIVKQGGSGLKKITTAIKEKRAKKKNETPS